MSKENDKIRRELGFDLFPERKRKEELRKEIDQIARIKASTELRDCGTKKEYND